MRHSRTFCPLPSFRPRARPNATEMIGCFGKRAFLFSILTPTINADVLRIRLIKEHDKELTRGQLWAVLTRIWPVLKAMG
jgi:hypothetical protein